MRRAEGIVFAFAALGKSGKAAALPQRMHSGAASGQNLVRIALMTDVPDQAVMRRIEYIMDSCRQFDHA